MIKFTRNDDLFSPIRFDCSVSDCSITDGDISYTGIRLSHGSTEKECDLEDKVLISRKESELQLNASDQNVTDKESINTCTPFSDKKASELLYAKKLDKVKELKDKTTEKEIPLRNFECLKSKETLNVLDCNTPKLYSEQNEFEKGTPRLRSLSSTKSLESEIKTTKPTEKSSSYSLKNSSVEKKGSSSKQSSENKPVDNSLPLQKNSSVLKSKHGSKKSGESYKKNTILNSVSKKQSSSTQGTEHTDSTAVPFEYEVSVEKIVRNCISSECFNMRQNMLIQQMQFCKELNRIQADMEKQHEASIRRLVNVIEELVEVKATLISLNAKC